MYAAELSLALLALLIVWGAVLVAFRDPLRALWREPVLRAPVAILESDDWGAGPPAQAAALERLREILSTARNVYGETMVMTIGVILETADRAATRAAGRYVAIELSAPDQTATRMALADGVRAGVFALQLHGMAHYWPPSLLARAAREAAVDAWLSEPGPGWTETLPPALQSRWTEATTLPSTPLDADAVRAAVALEVETWRRIFGTPPAVAVPTTFVWTPVVERAWAAAGLRVVVTPGVRYEGRGADGAPSHITARMRNGERGEDGLLYLVRDVYFEPALGHGASRLADGVLERTALGRPALVETHRFNFCGPRAAPDAFETLRAALAELLVRVPEVRFMSTAALAGVIERRDAGFVEHAFRRRAGVWARRARREPSFARWARATGLAWPLRALEGFA